jgi:hypothetical protein
MITRLLTWEKPYSECILFLLPGIIVFFSQWTGCSPAKSDDRNRLVETGDLSYILTSHCSYFKLRSSDPDSPLYVRAGRVVTTSDEGLLALLTSSGTFPFSPEIRVPSDLHQLMIEPDGSVLALDMSENSYTNLGTLECHVFMYGWKSTERLTTPFVADIGTMNTKFGLNSQGRGNVVLSGWRSID